MVPTSPLNQNKKITCLILIDGLRHDYLNKEDAPFLSSLEEKGIGGIVKETFAFQLRPAFFAGLYPEDCNIAHLYWYDPKDSPFWPTKYLPEIFFSLPFIKRYRHRLLCKMAKKTESKKGHTASRFYASPANIPYKLLKYFAFSEKYLIYQKKSLGKHTTLFDVLRENNLDWLWVAYPTHNLKAENILEEFKKNINTKHSLVFLHFAELDWIGHKYGPFSTEQKKTLKKIDDAVQKIFSTLTNMFNNLNALIFGDHGMVRVEKFINIEEILHSLKAKPIKDYIYFLDSTQARFWFKNKKTKTEIENALKNLSEGHILTEKEKKDLHFKFDHQKFGELIFIVHDHTLIFPNFFQNKKPEKGMHGYLPNIKGNWAKFIITDSDKTLNKIKVGNKPLELVDLFPITLNLMNLSKK
jgi:predicted AlkP superfamily pyrophosphatase or phosphodiesterase